MEPGCAIVRDADWHPTLLLKEPAHDLPNDPQLAAHLPAFPVAAGAAERHHHATLALLGMSIALSSLLSR